MKHDHHAQITAARFWTEAAHRLELDDPERDLIDLDIDRLFAGQPGSDHRARHGPPKGNRLIQFIYLRDVDFAMFVQTWIERQLTPEGRRAADELAASWPGMTDFIEEARAVQEDYRNSPHHQRMLDLIQNWDFEVSGEDNIARHHLRMSMPRTRQ